MEQEAVWHCTPPLLQPLGVAEQWRWGKWISPEHEADVPFRGRNKSDEDENLMTAPDNSLKPLEYLPFQARNG